MPSATSSSGSAFVACSAVSSSREAVAGRLDFALIARLREVAGDTPATESELRVLAEQADGWARALTGQIEASERRLRKLSAAGADLVDLADELRRLETLHPQLEEVRSLGTALDARARELRTSWLLHQAESSPSPARPPSPVRPSISTGDR